MLWEHDKIATHGQAAEVIPTIDIGGRGQHTFAGLQLAVAVLVLEQPDLDAGHTHAACASAIVIEAIVVGVEPHPVAQAHPSAKTEVNRMVIDAGASRAKSYTCKSLIYTQFTIAVDRIASIVIGIGLCQRIQAERELGDIDLDLVGGVGDQTHTCGNRRAGIAGDIDQTAVGPAGQARVILKEVLASRIGRGDGWCAGRVFDRGAIGIQQLNRHTSYRWLTCALLAVAVLVDPDAVADFDRALVAQRFNIAYAAGFAKSAVGYRGGLINRIRADGLAGFVVVALHAKFVVATVAPLAIFIKDHWVVDRAQDKRASWDLREAAVAGLVQAFVTGVFFEVIFWILESG